MSKYFNPRSDERSDTGAVQRQHEVTISIHAPTNGATEFEIEALKLDRISIHAPTNGATPSNASFNRPAEFQSTLRRTERRNNQQPAAELYYFNPRSDERSDIFKQPQELVLIHISIHAPTNGATIPSLNVWR